MIELTPDHKYICDGVTLPGFTEIANATGLVRYFNSDPWYMERGSAVHSATALYESGELDWDSVDAQIMGYLMAYISFKGDNSWFRPKHIEKSLAHPTYRYAGTPDRFLPLLDIKCGQGHSIQLAAYSELLRASGFDPGREGYLLNLNEDGSYKLTTYKYNRRDTGIWLSAVSLWHWRKEKGLLQ